MKQEKLPGMKVKTELEKVADEVVYAWEKIEEEKEELEHIKQRLVVVMEDVGMSELNLKDSQGQGVVIQIKVSPKTKKLLIKAKK